MDQNNLTALLNKVTDELINDTNVNTISFDESSNSIVITVKKIKDKWKIYAINDDLGNNYPIKYALGPDIVEHLGDLNREPPLIVENQTKVLGGMSCGLQGQNSYGTVTYTWHKLDITTDRPRIVCVASPSIASNAHVFSGPAGTRIWVNGSQNFVGKMHCALPLNISSLNVDFAQGMLDDFSFISNGDILTIGQYQGYTRAGKGHFIKKHGARSGYTEGQTIKQTNIRVNGRWFRSVWETSKGFGCSGDSGSAVFNSANQIVGVYSWGEAISCSSRPKGYFWAVHPDSQFNFKNYASS